MRVVGRQPFAPAAFAPATHLYGLSRLQSTWFRRGEPREKSPVTPPGIDPGNFRLAAQCLNHYATSGPKESLCSQISTVLWIQGLNTFVSYGIYVRFMTLYADPSGRAVLRRLSGAVRLLKWRVRIPPQAWMSFSCECFGMAGKFLCVGLITRPEESYWMRCVWVSLWSLDNEETPGSLGAVTPWKWCYTDWRGPIYR